MASNIVNPTLSGTQGGTITLTFYSDNQPFQAPAEGEPSVYTIETGAGSNIGNPQSVLTNTSSPSIQIDVSNLSLTASTAYKFFYDSGSLELSDSFGDPFDTVELNIINNISAGGGGSSAANNGTAALIAMGAI